MAQTVLACMPIKKLRILFLVKAVIVPPTFLALFLWAVIVTHGGGPLVTGNVVLTSTYMNTAYSALTGLNVIIGLFSSMAVNMPVGSWLSLYPHFILQFTARFQC
jgi:NCS1 family nucleobase:cation symporter-1